MSGLSSMKLTEPQASAKEVSIHAKKTKQRVGSFISHPCRFLWRQTAQSWQLRSQPTRLMGDEVPDR